MFCELVRFAKPCSLLLLAGCEAALGLNEFKVGASDAGVASAGAAGVRQVAGRSGMAAVVRPPDPQRGSGTAGEAQGPDGGTDIKTSAVDAAVSGGDAHAGQSAAAGDASAGSAGSAGSSSERANKAGSSATGDDAGTDTRISENVGRTGLRVSDILGYYSGDWGEMVLRRQGDELWGVYAYSDGTVVGRINDEGVFQGWWTQLPTRTGSDEGEVEFRWSRIANTTIALDGRWRYGSIGAWQENWDILRVTTRSAPAALTDRFQRADTFRPHP